MSTEIVNGLITAFNPSKFVNYLLPFAPYILAVAGILVAISLIKWGVSSVSKTVSTGLDRNYNGFSTYSDQPGIRYSDNGQGMLGAYDSDHPRYRGRL